MLTVATPFHGGFSRICVVKVEEEGETDVKLFCLSASGTQLKENLQDLKTKLLVSGLVHIAHTFTNYFTLLKQPLCL
jgi:inorganic pyrophosphatase